MTDYLDEMKNEGLPVNWGTVLVGLQGPGKFLPLLTLDDLRSFATDQLARATPEHEKLIVTALLAADEGNDESIAAVRILAQVCQADEERESRKWRVVLLGRAIDQLPSEPLYGLLALTEFWERFGYPADSPHVVQGRGHAPSPADYYTEANFRAELQRHQEWLRTETAALV
jgi:hypothetical protein